MCVGTARYLWVGEAWVTHQERAEQTGHVHRRCLTWSTTSSSSLTIYLDVKPPASILQSRLTGRLLLIRPKSTLTRVPTV